MLRVFLAASLTLPLVTQVTGQELLLQSAKPLTLAQVWTLNATYADPRHGVTFRHPGIWQAIPASRVRSKGDVMKALVIAVMQSMTVANEAAAKARNVRANAR